ncbi:tetratricopeptide repeat protein [uncultured Ferrimonas sp.]|uniref:tetratricopeptide repeat protein n=1 Tax=uncultured Ferrimonas sp. TaxID=432640 RepID=UPI00262EFA5B|nr:tetratricopeptide repeat protein [uncultured Ferrimonas sp.]
MCQPFLCPPFMPQLRGVGHAMLLVAALLFSPWGNASAATATAEEATRALFSFTPEGFSSPLEFHVSLPKGYSQNDKRYYLLLDLHPRSHAYLAGMHDWMSHNGEWPWPQSLVVTPSGRHPQFSQLYQAFMDDNSDTRVVAVLQQLLHLVDRRYRGNGFHIYSGFMGNGALGLTLLLQQPQLFNAYFIASPSISNEFAQAANKQLRALSKRDNRIRTLYLNSGNHNFEQGSLAAIATFEQALQQAAPTQLHWRLERSPEHYYMSRPVITTLNGIEMLFDDLHSPLSVDSAISQQGAEAIIEHYQDLSQRKYGLPVSAQQSLIALANSQLASQPQQAIAIFKRVTALYPTDAYAHSALADAYLELGQFSQAIAAQTAAVKHSKTMIKWHQNHHQQRLTKFEKMATLPKTAP